MLPICPLVAVIFPEMSAPVEYSLPLASTLNEASVAVAAPIHKGYSPPPSPTFTVTPSAFITSNWLVCANFSKAFFATMSGEYIGPMSCIFCQ